MRGADLLIDALQKAGVNTLFSLSGNQIMPVYDACLTAGIRIIHTRHEAAAVYMADAWAQITGTIGVALVAGGPGFSNSLSPLFSARHAESPVLLLSGDSPVSQDGLGAFQELDQTSMTRPLVKEAHRTRDVNDFAHDVTRLIAVAQAGRPGPVHLALPFDLLEAPAQAPRPQAEPIAPRLLDRAALDALTGHLNKAQRPVILTGPRSNPSRARTEIDRLQASTGIPVVPMESPRGLKDPSLGTFSQILAKADLIVLLGKKVDFTLQFGKAIPAHASVAIIDPDSDVIEHAQRQFGERLLCHAQADTFEAMAALGDAGILRRDDTWIQDVSRAIEARALDTAIPEQAGTVSPKTLCEQVQTLIDQSGETILICDGGEFGQWAQAFCHAPVRVINGVSGAIGGSLSYATAAKIARPDATVIAMMGDGTAGFLLGEFDTAARENADIIAVIGNDCKWNAEHLIQINSYGEDRTIGCSLSPEARYDLVAQGLGGEGFNVTTADELSQALTQACKNHKPVCINVIMNGQPAPVYAAS